MHRIDTIDSRLHDRLCNWARWVADQRQQGRCRSIEHRYVPERIDNDERRKQISSIPMDIFDAARIESAISSRSYPSSYRQSLIAYYVHAMPTWAIVRKARIRMCDLAAHMAAATARLSLLIKDKSTS
jgi:hypothetical protein